MYACFFRRLLVNPTYYDLESFDTLDVSKFLIFFVQGSLRELITRDSSKKETIENSEQYCIIP